jgi:hypothetical protein
MRALVGCAEEGWAPVSDPTAFSIRVVDSYAAGRIPYWDPYVGGGEPLGAYPAAIAFSPLLTLFALPVSFSLRYELFVASHVFVALFAQYTLARDCGYRVWPAWCGRPEVSVDLAPGNEEPTSPLRVRKSVFDQLLLPPVTTGTRGGAFCASYRR